MHAHASAQRTHLKPRKAWAKAGSASNRTLIAIDDWFVDSALRILSCWALCGQKIPQIRPNQFATTSSINSITLQSLASLRVGTRARADLDSGAGRGALQQRKLFLSLTLLQRGPATCARSRSPSS